MALPRPVMMALLGLLLVSAALVATRATAGGDDAGEVVPPPPSSLSAKKPKPSRDRTPSPDRADAAKPAPSPNHTPAKPRTDASVVAPKPSERSTARKAAKAGLSLRVARALGRGEVVVLLFTDRTSADGEAASEAVDSLKPKRGKLAVFRDRLEHLSNYRRIVDGVGVSQSPSIVIVDRKLGAQLIEGYVDPASLRQRVADVLR